MRSTTSENFGACREHSQDPVLLAIICELKDSYPASNFKYWSLQNNRDILLLFRSPAAVGGAVAALPAPPPRATSVFAWEPEAPFAIATRSGVN